MMIISSRHSRLRGKGMRVTFSQKLQTSEFITDSLTSVSPRLWPDRSWQLLWQPSVFKFSNKEWVSKWVSAPIPHQGRNLIASTHLCSCNPLKLQNVEGMMLTVDLVIEFDTILLFQMTNCS